MVKIMLVDDAAFIRMMIKKALTQNGYSDFAEAQDGAKAVRKYGEEKPDMITIDIMMSNMDGLQALKRIEESDVSAKIVMYTVIGRESVIVGVTRSGAGDFIAKPFNAEYIVQAVNSILGK